VNSTTHEQLYDAFGAYVRSQRQLARLTLRQVAELASISNPYLSQIEHGLALPSIVVLSALADALSVSAETMLLRAAGIVRPSTAERSRQTEDSIRHDSRLDNSQKHALLAVLASFVGSSAGAVPRESAPAESAPAESAPAESAAPDSVRERSVPAEPVVDESGPARSERVVAHRSLPTGAVDTSTSTVA
jgi:transcriptional regulator with XRE-family HTH domain